MTTDSQKSDVVLETTSNVLTLLNDEGWNLCIIDVNEYGDEIPYRYTNESIYSFHKQIKEIYDSFGLLNIKDIFNGENEIYRRDFNVKDKIITLYLLG